jgi:hypothetical protein
MADRISLEDQGQREGFFTGGYKERPAIHVAAATRANGGAFQQVEVGAEEEGVPCRLVEVTGEGAVALAYAAAQSSRFGVGVGIDTEAVAIHEVHMPADRPVLRFATSVDHRSACRLAGSNAARLVIRLPLRFADPVAEMASTQVPAGHPVHLADRVGEPALIDSNPGDTLSPTEIRAAVRAIVRVLHAHLTARDDVAS